MRLAHDTTALAPATTSSPVSTVVHVPQERWHEVMQRYDLARPFVLHYGPDAPARNTHRLIEAWAMTDKRVRQRMQLAIVGLSAASGDELVNVVNRLGLAQSIRLYRSLGATSDLSVLLSASDIVALPTLSPDFPPPVLEAWATRAAVLTSDTPSIAEAVGDAAVLVDPNDAGAIARGLTRLMKDARFRRDLIARGRERLSQCTVRQAAPIGDCAA